MPYTLQIPVLVVLIAILLNMGFFNHDLTLSAHGQTVQTSPSLKISPIDPGSIKLAPIDTTAPSPPPSLISPSDLSVIGPNSASFDWNDVKDDISAVTYDIEIYNVNSKTIVDSAKSLSKSSYVTTKSLPDGTYYWRVFAVDGSGNSSTSRTSTFTVDATPPPTPTNNGVTTTISTPYFEWSPVSDLSNVSYQFQISDDPSFAKISLVYDDILYSSTFSKSVLSKPSVYPTPSNIQITQSLPDGTYFWRVTAADDVGHTSKPSLSFSFTVDATPPPAPTLLSLNNGVTIRDTTPSFDWTDVDDVSSVAYQVEISTDPKFQSSFVVLLILPNLFPSHHTLLQSHFQTAPTTGVSLQLMV
jgi:hypothetical protein